MIQTRPAPALNVDLGRDFWTRLKSPTLSGMMTRRRLNTLDNGVADLQTDNLPSMAADKADITGFLLMFTSKTLKFVLSFPRNQILPPCAALQT